MTDKQREAKFEEWYAGNLRGRRTLGLFIWQAAWQAANAERDKELASEGLKTRIFNEITKLCNDAPEESSLCKLLPSQRMKITAAAIKAIREGI